jgi:serine/threonine protein kinase
MGPVASDAMIGRWVLDQYIVRAKLGEGGMGGVYLADQPAIGRQAVIKVIHPWLSRDKVISARFATEAKAAARLQNPHIVAIFNYGRMPDGTLFLAMEHLAGRTLAQLLRAEGRLDHARAVGIATQCCEALSHAHLRGVVHRDLKPSNIMLVRRDRGPEFVKVLDFGIAKLDGAGEGTTAGAVLGTPQYMAPEQLTGKPVDGRSDIYAVGLMLYEMITGRPPFVAENAIGYVHQHCNEMPLPLAQACPAVRVPPALEACLMRALAKSPHQRPQSAELFADELWSALMATVDSSHVPAPRLKPPAPARALVVGAVAAGIALVAGLSVAAFVWLRPEPRADPAAASASEPAPSQPSAPPRAPQPSPEQRALMAKSIPELEAELQRATILSGMPRESVELALSEYRNAVGHPPPGFDAGDYRRALLADLILQWRRHRAPIAPPDRPLSELEAVFLTMASSYSVEQRREMLLALRTATAGDPHADTLVYNRLLEWIAAYGDAEEPIEIIEDDEHTPD